MRTEWRRAPISVLAVTLGVALLAAPAYAQEDPQRGAAAKALYDMAIKAMDDGNFEGACPKLEEALRLEPAALGARLSLAECYEGAGRLSSAWTTYLTIEALAAKAGQRDREKLAHQKAEALRPKLAELTILVPAEVRALPGLAIRRDGIPVGEGQWGVPLPVDKGNHTIVITAPGKKEISRSFSIEKDGVRATLNVPVLRDLSADAPFPAAPSPLVDPVPAQDRPPPLSYLGPEPPLGKRKSGGTGFIVGGSLLMILGGSGAVGGAVLLGSDGSKERAAGGATMLVVGGVALVGGALLILAGTGSTSP